MIAPAERSEADVSGSGVTVVSDDVVSYASWLLRYMADSIESVDNYYDYADYTNNTIYDYNFNYNEV